jgi:hypothetical protein
MKPKITYLKLNSPRPWLCSCHQYCGRGYTPEEAYLDWKGAKEYMEWENLSSWGKFKHWIKDSWRW